MTPLLQIDNLDVTFAGRRRVWPPGAGVPIRALRQVSVTVGAGETVGLVGESGSGKTTLGRVVLGLVKPSSGSVVFDGRDVAGLRGPDLRWLRGQVQAVFQDPYSSLTPTMNVGALLLEGLRRHRGLTGAPARKLATDLLERVRLDGAALGRYPSEFSGGQRQRIAIARALTAEPRLLICDEPVSALDVSTQADVVNLLQDLQRETGMSYLFVAHDIAVVHHVSDRIAVLYRGRMVEQGPAETVYQTPAHPYTRMLLESVPEPDPAAQRRRREARQAARRRGAGEPPEHGCPFAPRCPHETDECRVTFPPRRPSGAGGYAACHLQTHDSQPERAAASGT